MRGRVCPQPELTSHHLTPLCFAKTCEFSNDAQASNTHNALVRIFLTQSVLVPPQVGHAQVSHVGSSEWGELRLPSHKSQEHS